MRTTGVWVAVLSLTLAAPAVSQSWVPAFGVQGGFARVKPAGTHANDHFDLLGLPGTDFSTLGNPFGTLFGIVPLGGRFAVEPRLGASQFSLGLATITGVRLGARLNVAVGGHVYGAVGGTVDYLSVSGGGGSANVGPLGVTVALGYRAALSRRLEGRIEAQFAGEKGSKSIGSVSIVTPPVDEYSLQFGISSSFRDRGVAPSTSDALWTPAIGIQGGYYGAHFFGAGTLTGFSVPGLGTSTNLTYDTFVLFPQTASTMVLIPLAGRWAVEGGFSMGRVQAAGPGNFTLGSVTLSARADYAVTRGWYAGAGPVTNSYKITARPAAAQTGFSLAWGYRFRIAGDVGGRAEASYTVFAHNHVLGVPPVNVLGLDLGVMMGL